MRLNIQCVIVLGCGFRDGGDGNPEKLKSLGGASHATSCTSPNLFAIDTIEDCWAHLSYTAKYTAHSYSEPFS